MNSFDFSSKMKVPTRPAPPPPTKNSWSSFTFDPLLNQNQKSNIPKKKPPPRPPPPKLTQPRPTDHKGSQLVSGLFPRSQPRPMQEQTGSLIDWSSPPSSPSSTTRSSSDALSVKSFGSDSVTPSSGSTSNVESGFEDDFDLYSAPPSRVVDPWSPPPPSTKSAALPSWTPFSPSVPKKHIMPTIIRVKPERPKVPKVLEKKIEMNTLAEVFSQTSLVEKEEEAEWSSESPPMPTCPPPAPPPELLAGLLEEAVVPKSAKFSRDSTQFETAVALFDYQGAPGDLSFRQGDRILVLRRIDQHWLYAELAGRQGSVPANYVQMETSDPYVVTALYTFHAETWEDLALEPGIQVRILGQVNSDWLYGEVAGKRGQFPAAFVDHVPAALTTWSA